MYPEYESDLKYARNVHKEYGKSFYFGTKLMTAEFRDAICILYAFFRLPDEYVDTQYKDQKNIALQKLNQWKENWTKCYKGENFQADGNELKVLRSTKYIFDKYKIPFEYSEAFISAMIQDTHKTEYGTYKELEDYMFGSASVVGLMMVCVIADDNKKLIALEYAQSLGEAFQMTNFLRDIYEDVRDRDRVYLPIEDMKKFGVTKQDLLNKNINDNFINLMKFEIERTQSLYKKADIGLKYLPKKEALAIKVARVLYSKIIDKIESANYDVFSSRLHLSLLEKIYWAVLTLIKRA